MKWTQGIVTVALFCLSTVCSGQGNETQRARQEEEVEPTLRGDNEFRIVGGSNAPSGKYPYMVKGSGCGASLIAPDIALTAAHCDGNFGRVRIGSTSRNSGGELIDVDFEITHPQYSGNSKAYDFMILKLKKESKYEPVKLNGKSNWPSSNSNMLTVIGFGDTQEGGSSSSTLRQVNVPYIPNNSCQNSYGSSIKGSMLCAGYSNGGQDSCQGDSGGPIMDANGVQVGVVSWGSGCARPNRPGVYARTSSAIGWINQMVCKHSPKHCPGNEDNGGGDSDGENGGGDSGGNDGPANIDLRVRVVHDKYPDEVYWRLMNQNGKVLLRQNENEVSTKYADTSKSTKVSAGKYRFEIDDGYGDGLCCKQGPGKVEIYANGKMVANSDGRYEDSETLEFTVSSDDSGGDTGGGDTPSTSVVYKVDVQYDLYPEEFSWSIRDSSGKTIIGRGVDTVFEWRHFLSEEIQLSPGKTYQLQLRDGYGDGITYKEDGFVEIYALVDGQKKRLHYDDGDFGKRRDSSFSVPGNIATKSATQRSVSMDDCRDQREEFRVDDRVGDKDCRWLSYNKNDYEYLCELVAVASTCPSTCGACGLFSN